MTWHNRAFMHYGLGFTGGVGSNSSLSSYRYRGNNTPIFQRIYHLFKEEKKSEKKEKRERRMGNKE
jgi:hypothetical protein